MTELVGVVQADRERAAVMLRKIDLHFYADEAAEGQANHSAVVQAFAAHRIAALSGIEDVIGALEVVAGGSVDVSDTAIIVGNGASTVLSQVRQALASYSNDGAKP